MTPTKKVNMLYLFAFTIFIIVTIFMLLTAVITELAFISLLVITTSITTYFLNQN